MPEPDRPAQGQDQPVNRSSDRQFGLVMAGFFTILAAIAAWRGSGAAWLGLWLAIAAAFAAAALATPSILAPLNRIWFRFGLLLHKVMTPLIMALMFFVVITPIALAMRLFGKRPIPLRFDKAAQSYWIGRDPAGPGPMSKQY